MREDRADRLLRQALAHLDGLYGAALRMTGNRQDAEDLVQDTYLRAMRGLAGHRGDSLSRAWIFRILTNAWIDRYRYRGTRPKEVAWDEALHPDDGRAPELASRFLDGSARIPTEVERVLHRTVSDEVKRAIDSLPDPFRVTLVLRDVVGFTYAEIAEILDIPIGTVMSRLHRARGSLRHSLTALAPTRGRAHANAMAGAVAE